MKLAAQHSLIWGKYVECTLILSGKLTLADHAMQECRAKSCMRICICQARVDENH
jgi:hypothetical protein